MNRYKFEAKIGDEVLYPKGFYYQGKKHIVLVGCVLKDHTMRRKELVDNVNIKIS